MFHILKQRHGGTTDITQPAFVTTLRRYKKEKKGKVPFNLIPFNPKNSSLMTLPPVKKTLPYKEEEEEEESKREAKEIKKQNNFKIR